MAYQVSSRAASSIDARTDIPRSQTFGDNLRAARKQADFRQEAFAYHCGLDRSYVGQVERGEKNVTLRTIMILARALEVAPQDLLVNL